MENDRMERRVSTVRLETRDDGAGNETPTIRGHAAVFDQWSEDLGGFREKIAPGAFTRALKEQHDVRALFNHNPDRVLGRYPKTLRMAEDDVGLAVEIDPPAGEAGLLELMRREDVTQMSFGFIVKDEEWREGEDYDERTIKDVDLFDVSVVTYPAYPQTDAAVRSHDQWQMQRDVSRGEPVLPEELLAASVRGVVESEWTDSSATFWLDSDTPDGLSFSVRVDEDGTWHVSELPVPEPIADDEDVASKLREAALRLAQAWNAFFGT